MWVMKSGYILNGFEKQYRFTYDVEFLQLELKGDK